jgi:predicted alpha/beta hydrolase
MSPSHPAAAPTSEPRVIRCDDGVALHCTVFPAAPARDRGVTVIVCPAVLVRQRYYAAFAAYLAEQGVRAITVANRGMGTSLAAEARPAPHRLRDWGERDLPAVVAWAKSTEPTHRLSLVGHSMGGQIVGLTDSIHALDSIVTVVATAAWWGHWPFPTNVGILAWYLTIPVMGRALKAVPADRFGMGPDMTTSLARDWARWGRHPEYLAGPFGHTLHMRSYAGRVLAYSFTDDEHLGCRRAVDALHSDYLQAGLVRRHVDPASLGVPAVGHFGYFRRTAGAQLWAETVDFITAESAAVPATSPAAPSA